MAAIGRRIFYDLVTGKLLRDSGEREGDVRPTTPLQDFPGYDSTTMNFMSLSFGARAAEFSAAGFIEVDPNTAQLIIYPRLQLVADKTAMPATVGTATITASGVVGNVSWTVNNGEPVVMASAAGKCVFQLSSQLPGNYLIVASDQKHGAAIVEIEVTP